jgi:uncharacterized membrane protein YtjA (UPF0391 family)
LHAMPSLGIAAITESDRADSRAPPVAALARRPLPSHGEPGTRLQVDLFPEIATRTRGHTPGKPLTEESMLYWALVFFIIAIIAGFLGFGGIAFAAAGIAKILFFIFLVVFVVMLLTGLMGRRSPPI